MARIDLLRVIRNYLPIRYRDSAIERLLYALFSPMEAASSELERLITRFRETNIDLSLYSIDVVKLRIWNLYRVDGENEPVSTRIAISEPTNSRQLDVRFGVDHVVNDGFHLGRLRDFVPAGTYVNILYDT